jgi:hypothetical protein
MNSKPSHGQPVKIKKIPRTAGMARTGSVRSLAERR